MKRIAGIAGTAFLLSLVWIGGAGAQGEKDGQKDQGRKDRGNPESPKHGPQSDRHAGDAHAPGNAPPQSPGRGHGPGPASPGASRGERPVQPGPLEHARPEHPRAESAPAHGNPDHGPRSRPAETPRTERPGGGHRGTEPIIANPRTERPGGGHRANEPVTASPPERVRTAWMQHRARTWSREHRPWRERGGYHGYRIPTVQFETYFGRRHRFRIDPRRVVVVGSTPRFEYDGYWFWVVDPWPEYWPVDWWDRDYVFVDYVDDGYYLCDTRDPRVRLAIEISIR